MLHDFVERLNAVKSQQQPLYSDILAYIVEICAQFKCQRENKHHTCGHRPARPIVEPELLLFLSLLVRRKEAAPAQMNAAAAFKSPVQTLHLIIARPSQPSQRLPILV